MTIEQIIAEFEKGCSNGVRPEDCPECVRAFVDAIKTLHCEMLLDELLYIGPIPPKIKYGESLIAKLLGYYPK